MYLQEDEATNDLQNRVAKLAGFEAGLFCVSGTMVSKHFLSTFLNTP